MFSRTLFSRLPKPLSCRIIAPLVTKLVEAPYHNSALTSQERAAVDAHLAACPACYEEAEAIRAVGQLLRQRGADALPAHIPAPNLWERIEENIIAEEQVVRRSPSLRPVLIFAPALAAIVVAVVLVPKYASSPTPPTASKTAAISAPVLASAPLFGSASISLNEEKTAIRSSATITKPSPAVSHSRFKSASSHLVAIAAQAQKRNQPGMRHRNSSDLFTGTIEIVPVPRGKSEPVSVAFNLPKPTVPLRDAHMGRSTAKPAPLQIASATMEPRPVAPSTSFANQTEFSLDRSSKTITVVNSDTGDGVSATAYTPPPVTDTLIRQRQKRGLFGGYGTGGTMAVLPSGSSTGSEGGTASPW